MISKTYIQSNLTKLEKMYNKSSSTQDSLFFSKLAIIEMCGWIEISMDDIINRLAKRILRDISNLKYIEKDVIKRNYGFAYDDHFKKMLISLLGIYGVEKLESKVNPLFFTPMVATLKNLKTIRDQEAHIYIKGTTRSIDAPSITRSKFSSIFNGLKDIDEVLKNNF
jgi:hypothetical protein